MANFTKENYLSALAPANIYKDLIKRYFIEGKGANQLPGSYDNELNEVYSYIKLKKDLIYNINVNPFDEDIVIPITEFPFFRMCIFIEGDFIDISGFEVTIGDSGSEDINISMASWRTDEPGDIPLSSDDYVLYVEKISDVLKKVIIVINPDIIEKNHNNGYILIEPPLDVISEINAMVF